MKNGDCNSHNITCLVTTGMAIVLIFPVRSVLYLFSVIVVVANLVIRYLQVVSDYETNVANALTENLTTLG